MKQQRFAEERAPEAGRTTATTHPISGETGTFARQPSPSGLYDADGNPVRLIVVEKTPTGTVRRLAPFAPRPGRMGYYEYISDARWAGIPLVHIAGGRNPETGRLVRAQGVVAIGQFAVGVVSIGQVSVGVLSIGQLTLGGLAAVGQLAAGTWAVGQLAVGVQAAVGMLAAGFRAVGLNTFTWG